MRLAVSGKYQRALLRGAAVFMVGGLAAGCSSDVTRFQDSIMTGSTRAPQAPVQQAYPGDYAQVDQMSTGSVARGGGGILNRGRSSPRPQGNVGGGYAAQNPYPVQN